MRETVCLIEDMAQVLILRSLSSKLAEVDEAIAKHHKLIRLAEECRFADLVSELQAEVDRDGRWRNTLATIIERLSADPRTTP